MNDVKGPENENLSPKLYDARFPPWRLKNSSQNEKG